MKKKSFFAMAIFSMLVASCASDDETRQMDALVPVEIRFTTLEISMKSDAERTLTTRAMSTAKDMNVTRLALKIFDSGGSEIFAKNISREKEVTAFEKIDCQLPIGDYTFVAVAHQAGSVENQHATIKSETEATIPMSKVPNAFAKTLPVKVDGKKAKTVSMNLGYRITSTFQLKITDKTPADVAKCEIIINPEVKAPTSFIINPTTGFVADKIRNAVTYTLANISNNTFTNAGLVVRTFLQSDNETVDVLINMKSSEDKILYSQTLTDVPMQPHHTTIASGVFFTSGISFSFETDPTDSEIKYQLNQ